MADSNDTMSDMFRGEEKERSAIVNRNFGRWYGTAPAGDHCEICFAAFEPGADFLIGKSLSVADMQVCSIQCALDALGGPEATKPEPPVPTRELARDAWKRLGASDPSDPYGHDAASECASGVAWPADVACKRKWTATDALLELLGKYPLGTAPAADWQYVYRLLHPTALNAECDDLLRRGRA